ncbi:MAG TPA: saccharopine dehydrogenase C-terminal domain-containing protein [Longimicrobiaceae bacterium]|nr:saccharopine dehydrogenase C-terminal domain-containing protein [Longimicrobiaceae bacterium]
MPLKVVVLGAGRVGSAIVRDLAAEGEFAVTAADASPASLARLEGVAGVTPVRADLSDAGELERLLAPHDLVVGAVPGWMGFRTLEGVLRAGKPVVDISFFDADPFRLDALARERGVAAVVDCGVAPGCSNLILGRLETVLDETERFFCCVGGLPVLRSWPYEYKAPFSPADVIEEYVRPARFRRHGEDVTLPALSEVELLEFPGVGTLEAFNTDGLRTLLATSRAPSMVEKTMRYPGHAEKMRMLRETGFFGEEAVELGGARVRPLDLAARLLFRMWQLGEGEEDLTAMRVEVEGRRGGRRVRYSYELLDRYDRASGTSSMARTTGYTCTAAVRLLARGLYARPGISPPEYLGREPGCYDFMMGELAARGVVFRETVTKE